MNIICFPRRGPSRNSQVDVTAKIMGDPAPWRSALAMKRGLTPPHVMAALRPVAHALNLPWVVNRKQQATRWQHHQRRLEAVPA